LVSYSSSYKGKITSGIEIGCEFAKPDKTRQVNGAFLGQKHQ
jgi:hypothetical protein